MEACSRAPRATAPQMSTSDWIVPDLEWSTDSNRFWRSTIEPYNSNVVLDSVRRRRPSRAKIAIVAGGGIGDLLQIADLAEALKHRFAPCDVFVFYADHRPPEQVTAFNPNISGVIVFKEDRDRVMTALYRSADFDILVSWRYLLKIKKTRGARVNLDKHDRFFRDAEQLLSKWKVCGTFHPQLNNSLGRKVLSLGATIYDVEALSSGLDLSISVPPAYFPDPKTVSPIPVTFGKYVTVHHGFDKSFVSKKYNNNNSTKCLPIETWSEVVENIARLGISIVQVGLDYEEPVPGITFDLRGKTNISETAAVLKGALCHLDTEGGLVHLARRVHTPAVVAFGPTPSGLFGYPENANLSSISCSNCWWTTDDWVRRCPLGAALPACMLEHSPKQIVTAALPIIKARSACYSYQVVDSLYQDESQDVVLERWIGDVGANTIAFIVSGQSAERVLALHDVPDASRLIFVCDAEREDLLAEFSGARFASATNLPAEDLAFDLVIMMLPSHNKEQVGSAVGEGTRITAANGHLIILCEQPPLEVGVKEILLRWSHPANYDSASALLVRKRPG